MSQRSQIRDMLASKGEAAARDLGEKLRIKESTLNAYISHFLKHGAAITRSGKALDFPVDQVVILSGKKELKPIKFADGVARGVAVYDVGNPERHGVVHEFGPEQCLVQWPGAEKPRAVGTAWLRALPKDAKERALEVKRSLKSLEEVRIVRVKTWIGTTKPRPNDKEIWKYIRNKWPSLTREQADKIYQET